MADPTETLWCESCGEGEQEIHLQHAGVCGDCFASQISELIREQTGDHFCCRPLFVTGKLAGVCMLPYGSEHAHGNIVGLDAEGHPNG